VEINNNKCLIIFKCSSKWEWVSNNKLEWVPCKAVW